MESDDLEYIDVEDFADSLELDELFDDPAEEPLDDDIELYAPSSD